MRKKTVIATAIAFFIGSLFAPPDLISQLTFGAMAAFLCAVPLLVLARLAFVKTASQPMHTLVCVLVCTPLSLPPGRLPVVSGMLTQLRRPRLRYQQSYQTRKLFAASSVRLTCRCSSSWPLRLPQASLLSMQTIQRMMHRTK